MHETEATGIACYHITLNFKRQMEVRFKLLYRAGGFRLHNIMLNSISNARKRLFPSYLYKKRGWGYMLKRSIINQLSLSMFGRPVLFGSQVFLYNS